MTMQISGSNGVTFPNNSTQTAGADLINNTGAGSDITLNMGQTAYITFSGATAIPLRVATGNDQVYEINFRNNGAVSANPVYLALNNTNSQTNFFQIYSPTSPTNGSATYNFGPDAAGFRIGVGGTVLWATIKCFTSTYYKSVLIQGRDTNTTIGYGYTIQGNATDTTTAWTSLGTINCGTALSGTVWIRRVG